jgi:hypothetical protein
MTDTRYPQVYHLACNHLVAFGGHGGDTRLGRKLCADALRAIRAKFGRERAQRERFHLLFISGQFPVKGSSDNG